MGDYDPDKRTGPAIWLRCILSLHSAQHDSNTERCEALVSRLDLPFKVSPLPPILYLPGVSGKDLRDVKNCPDHIKPLIELQYRGVIWSQISSKDWTILAFLKSDQGGLGLDVAQDNDAKKAMQLSFHRLLDEELEILKGKRLDRDYFNTLLMGGDPIRDLLLWLDQGETFQTHCGENEWRAFVEVCTSRLAFNPQREGVLTGAAKLATHEGPWYAVWERFCEAPKRYPNIPSQIRKCQTPSFDLFSNEKTAGGWPQWNDDQEKNLHQDLMTLSNVPAHESRNRIKELEMQHGRERSLVWAELGDAPLACALEHLAAIAEHTKTSLAAGSIEDLVAGYSSYGWKCDDAVVKALAHVENNATFEAVSAAIRRSICHGQRNQHAFCRKPGRITIKEAM